MTKDFEDFGDFSWTVESSIEKKMMSVGTQEQEIEAIIKNESSSSIKATLIDLTEDSELLKQSSRDQVAKTKKKRKKAKKTIRNIKMVNGLAITEE